MDRSTSHRGIACGVLSSGALSTWTSALKAQAQKDILVGSR